MVRSRQDNYTETTITSCFDGTSEPGELRGGKLFKQEGIANPWPGGPGNLKLGVNVLGRQRTSFVWKRVSAHARCIYPGKPLIGSFPPAVIAAWRGPGVPRLRAPHRR